ncbi:MAG: hypothetical protein Q4B09_07565 [Lachnospiraceae bacterium]|nr:hypothetical protein [Lachnospiraceae bacterium]
MQTIEQAMEALHRKRTQIRICLLIVTGIVITAVILGFVMHMVWPGVILLAAAMALYAGYVRPSDHRYGEMFGQAVLRFGTFSKLHNLELAPKGSLSTERFQELAMFPLMEGEKSLMVRNSVEGDFGGMHLTASETTFHYKIEKQAKKYYKFLSGSLLIADLKGNRSGDWLLLQKGLLNEEIQQETVKNNRFRVCELQDDFLKNHYVLYTRNEDGSRLPEEAEQQIRRLAQKIEWISAVRLYADGAAVFMNKRFYLGNRRTNIDPKPEDFRKNTLPEREELFSFFRWWGELREPDRREKE